MKEKYFLTGICAFENFGPARVKLLLSFFEKAENIWKASISDLLKVGLNKDIVFKFNKHRNNFDIKNYFKKLEEYSINVLSVFDESYPTNLKKISDAPMVLYVRGNLNKSDSNAIAIVGSRTMSPYGNGVAQQFATELARNRITVISGLALGIDAVAQRAAYTNGGRTIAVLASGLDIISPLTNKSLALEFIKKNGAIVSEYPLGHTPDKSDFAVRNRIISGLSKAVIVIEAQMKSGTFHTVKAALDQGRPVFAVPGQITSTASVGANYLIQNGATPALNISDILQELNLELKKKGGVT